MREQIDPNIPTPLPFGVRFTFREQLQIPISETFFARLKRIFGYIATIDISVSAAAGTAACFPVISKMRRRYGLPARGTQ